MEILPEEIDNWRTAHCLVQRYGPNAYNVAILRSERTRLNGNFLGYKSWREIGSKVRALQCGYTLESELI
jgi:hypothetical protein